MAVLKRDITHLLAAAILALCCCSCAVRAHKPSASSVTDVTIYDGNYLWSLQDNSVAHEHMQLLAVLGGLVNRDAPRLFVNSTASDSYWFTQLSQAGGWLANATVSYETSISQLVNTYKEYVNGVILFDGSVPSTSNVASTISGIENLLPILSGGSLYSVLCESADGPKLTVSKSVVGMFDGSVTGSKKTDAYEWFRTNYMNGVVAQDTQSFNPAYQGYLMVINYLAYIFVSFLSLSDVSWSRRITGGQSTLEVPTS
jgi:hypothetical protein